MKATKKEKEFRSHLDLLALAIDSYKKRNILDVYALISASDYDITKMRGNLQRDYDFLITKANEILYT